MLRYVSRADEGGRAAFGSANVVAMEARLRAEDAARALLAGEAVANGDAHRLALRGEVELAAAA